MPTQLSFDLAIPRPNRPRRHPFGLNLSTDSARDIARAAINAQRHPHDGVALVVTPNINHVAIIRRSTPMARAYKNAERICCDGWPVQLYARLCGAAMPRVTGCEITAELMRASPFPAWQRLFFVVDNQATRDAVRAWADRHGLGDACATAVPPFGFETDAAACATIANAIAAHGTTILIMAVGAPRSEIFVDRNRASLPPCWAFCVGQAVKIELNLIRRASSRWQAVGLEWLWRLKQEPSRLTKRYLYAAIGFSAAILEDQWRGGLRTQEIGPLSLHQRRFPTQPDGCTS
jgi:N-acetylglucosaminyldiphosphoundecaprenol N-acetyl-beta-D-mannosaminyltransferase